MHVENYTTISRCVENVYVRHVENRVEIRKNHHHSLQCVLKLSGRGPKIRRQTTRLESEFTRVTEVRHIDLSDILQRSVQKLMDNVNLTEQWLQLFVDLPTSCLCSIQQAVNELDYNSDSSEENFEQFLNTDEDLEMDMSIIQQMLYEVVKYFCKVHLKDILAFLKKKLNKKRTMRLRATVGKVDVGSRQKADKFPAYMCKVCGEECKEFYDTAADYSVQCDTYEDWFHYPCEGLTGEEEFLQEGSTLPFKCTFCKMEEYEMSINEQNSVSTWEQTSSCGIPLCSKTLKDTTHNKKTTGIKRKSDMKSNIPCKKTRTSSGRNVKPPVKPNL